jgi:hypothetical protein
MADRVEPENRQGADAPVPAEPARVFISYASQDVGIANSIVEALER